MKRFRRHKWCSIRPVDLDNWQHGWFGGAHGFATALPYCRFDVLGDLLWRFKILFVGRIFVVLAVVGCVLAADFWSRVIDPTAVIRLQMFTLGMHQQVPRLVFDKHACPLMQQEPPHEVKISHGIGGVDGQCKVTAAFRRAVLAEDLAGGKQFPRHALCGHINFADRVKLQEWFGI